MTNEVLIKCENVSKKFCRNFKQSLVYGLLDVLGTGFRKNTHHNRLRKNEFWAVKDISFELRRGECLGLIGHNGAGKSTLLKMLNGLITPDQGKITMRGRIGALIELGAGFNPILTGRENIYNNGAILGFSRDEIDKKIDRIIEFSEIGEFIDSPVQNYSSGMKVRLGFAVAAQMEPDVLIIDEVLAVGDLGFIIKCLNRMGEMIPNCATIFVSHSMPMMARISNQVLLMDKGKEKYFSHDIAEGIKQYVDLFDSPARIDQGNGHIQLFDVKLKKSNQSTFTSDENLVFHTFDDLELEITLNIDASIKQFELFLTTFDGQLREVMSSLSGINHAPFLNHQENLRTFHIKIPNITMASGKYSLTIGAADPITKQFYCRVTNAIYFTMKAVTTSWATTVVPGEWVEVN